MKILVLILGFLNGGYMLTDGIYVMLNGKYIGPDKPGPWANLFYKLNLDVFKLGPLFMALGILWICWLGLAIINHAWAYAFGLGISIATLWYLPAGTLFSLVIIAAHVFMKDKLYKIRNLKSEI